MKTSEVETQDEIQALALVLSSIIQLSIRTWAGKEISSLNVSHIEHSEISKPGKSCA